MAAFKKLRGQIDFGMFLPVQKAAIAALTGPLDMVKTQCGLYQQRRDALCGGLRSIGWNVPDSHGSMFVWAPIPAKYAKSMDFCLDLVEKSGVLCTPGSSFGPLGEGYVRFALTLPPERIAEAVQSIKASGILETKKVTGTSMRRSRYFYAFTIFSPAPSSHVRRLLAVISISRCRASLVAHAMCGVSRAFGRPRKGLACGSGSVPKASAP